MANYFIGEKYLKENTPITANCAVEDIIPFVKSSSDAWMQPILGTYFYDYLLGVYNAQTLSADELVLVEKIKPCVAWRSASEAVLGLTLQLKNKGLQKQNSDNSESVEDSTMKFVMAHYRQKAESYEGFLISWLKENKDLFPNFVSQLNKDSIIKPQTGNNYNATLFFV